MSDYYVYIMTNRSGTLYVGMTNDLLRRVQEHRDGATPGFTKRYAMTRLVYVESTPDVSAAIEREKQVKGWLRRRKIALIEEMNPRWLDLADEWLEGPSQEASSGARGQILRSAQNDNAVLQGTVYV